MASLPTRRRSALRGTPKRSTPACCASTLSLSWTARFLTPMSGATLMLVVPDALHRARTDCALHQDSNEPNPLPPIAGFDARGDPKKLERIDRELEKAQAR